MAPHDGEAPDGFSDFSFLFPKQSSRIEGSQTIFGADYSGLLRIGPDYPGSIHTPTMPIKYFATERRGKARKAVESRGKGLAFSISTLRSTATEDGQQCRSPLLSPERVEMTVTR